MNAPTTNYLVCATHRSGSNLLCQMLWHSNLAGYPQEAFSPTRMVPIAAEYGLKTDPEADFPGYVRELMALRQSPNGVFGAKMMWKHLSPFCLAFGGDPANPMGTLHNVFPNLKFLWVRRRGVVRQAISMVKAKQSRVFNTLQLAPGEEPRQNALAYDFAAIDKEVKRFTREDAAWDGFFKSSGIRPAVVVYEDFVKNFDTQVRDVLRHLGVSVPDDYLAPPTNYRRQSDATNEEWAARYEQDRARAAG